MFKKIFFILFGFLLFLFIISGLLILNSNYFLNSPKIKTKLFSFLKKNYHIELNYDKIKIDLFKKRASIKNLSFNSSQYELLLPEGKFYFSLRKFLKLNFIPEEIIIPNGYLKVYKSKKPFKLEDLTKIFSRLYPFYLDVNNITLDYESSEGWINFKKLNLKLKVDKYQALYEVESKSNLFEKTTLKGRFNYKNLYSENTLDVKNLDLSNFKKLADYGISKTSLNVKSELVFEKGDLNISFVLSDPYIIFKKAPSERLLGGYLEGILVSNKEKTEITLNPLIINYPKIEGFLNLIKDKKGYKVLASAKRLNLADIENLLLKLFPENKEVKSVSSIIREGEFYDVKIESSGKSIKDIFNTKNLAIKGVLDKGKIKISELPLDFENINGELTFEKNILHFKGDSSVNKKTPLKVKELTLDLGRENPDLFIEGDFYTSAEEFIDIIAHFIKNPKDLKKYEFKGDLKGSIKLTGKVTDVKGKIEVSLNDLLVKTPYCEDAFVLKGGTLSYDFSKIFVENLNIISKNAYVGELRGNFDLKSFDVELLAKNVWISQEFVKKASEKSEKIKDIFSKYSVSFDKINIDYLEYKDNLGYLKGGNSSQIDYFNKDIVVKGVITGLTFKIPYKKESFDSQIKELPFMYEKGKVIFGKSLVNIEDSIFEVEGKIENKKAFIQGKGKLNEGLKNKIEKFSKILSKASIKTPIEFNQFKLIYDNGTLQYFGDQDFFGANVMLSLNLNKNKDYFDFDLAFLDKNSDFKVQFKKELSQIDLKAKGYLELKEFFKIFEQRKYEFTGKLETALNLSVTGDLKVKDVKDLFNLYLTSKVINLQESYLKLENLKYFYNGTPLFLVSLAGNFTDENFKIPKFSLKWNTHYIEGNFEVKKKKNYLYLSGDLFGEKADLRKFIKKEKITEESKDVFQIFNDIPLIADFNFHINELILLTSHQFQNINGEMSFDNLNKILMINVPKIHFCQLNLQAIYEKTVDTQYIFIEVLPSKGDFLDLFSCLYPEEMPKVILEGPFRLEGYYYAEGDKEKMIKKGVGAIEVNSDKGYIYRAPLLARIFAYLSPIDLFRGKVPNLENRLLEYEELDVKAVINDTNLRIDNGFLSAVGFRLFSEGNVDLSTEKLNLTFYISPFKTIDVIIEKVPHLGKWILGKPRMLIYLPLQVTGTYKNYTIIPLHPSSVGKGIFDFIFRIFGIPEEFYKEATQFKELKKQELLEQKEKHEKINQVP